MKSFKSAVQHAQPGSNDPGALAESCFSLMCMCLHGAEWACTLQHCSRVEGKQARGPPHPPAVGRHAPAGPGGCWPGQKPHCSRDRTAVHAAAPVAHAAAAAGQLHRILGLSQVGCWSVQPGLSINLSFGGSLPEDDFRRCLLGDLPAEAAFKAEASAAWHQHKPDLLSVTDGLQLWNSGGPSALSPRTACRCCSCKSGRVQDITSAQQQACPCPAGQSRVSRVAFTAETSDTRAAPAAPVEGQASAQMPLPWRCPCRNDFTTCRLRPVHARQSNSRGEAPRLTAQAQSCTCAPKPQQGGWIVPPPNFWRDAGAV